MVDYFDTQTCDTWETNVTKRREIETAHIHSLGFRDTREGVTLWRLGCIQQTKITRNRE